MPVASCRTPMSETYGVIWFAFDCDMGGDLDLPVLSVLSVLVTMVMGNPNEREKAIGYTMACAPVTMALQANIRLTALKVRRGKDMIGRDEDCSV